MMAQLSGGSVESRIAAVLLMLAENYGHASDAGLVIEVPLTRQDIAEMAGTTVESTIRTMSSWQKQGHVVTKAKAVTIVNQDRLIRLISH
jgi:CRP/FNR family transcriptional regulator